MRKKWLDHYFNIYAARARRLNTDSALGAPWRPELSSWARCTAAGLRGRSPPAVHSRGHADLIQKEEPRPRPDHERRAMTASPQECTAGVQELHRMSGSPPIGGIGARSPRRGAPRRLSSTRNPQGVQWFSLSLSLVLRLSFSLSQCISQQVELVLLL